MSAPSSSSFIQVTQSNQLVRQNSPSGSSPSMSPSSARQQVKVVAGYALQQKLGSGSFAVVYKGVRLPQHEQHQDRGNSSNYVADTVAIKAITRSSEKLTKKVLQNLEVEISILRTYRHRNIVCLHDVQKTERHFYLILEYCGGGDLQRLIRSRKAGRLSEGLTRRLMRDLTAGLKFLWGQELIHRDIKPQNLLLTGALPLDELNDPEKNEDMERKRREANFPSSQFVLKIADFGFARHLQTASLAETLCGSPLYMAPEILQHHRYDAKADLWSVGTVLFEMISGRPPFHGENHIDLLRNIQRKAVRLPPDVRISKECVNLLRLLLSRNPLSRAGFKEYFEASDAFVALGCLGNPTVDEGTCQRPLMDLGTIPENDGPAPGTESMLTVTSAAPPQQTFTKIPMPAPTDISPTISSKKSAAIPVCSRPSVALTKAPVDSRIHYPSLTPLVPSPPNMGASPIYAATAAAATTISSSLVPQSPSSSRQHQQPLWQPQQQLQPQQQHHQQQQQPQQQQPITSPQSIENALSEENSFVMVEYGGTNQKSPTNSNHAALVAPTNEPYRHQYLQTQDISKPRLEQTPPPPVQYLNRNPAINAPGEYMVVKQAKGMLSTSPGTGGALMGMLSGRGRLLADERSSTGKKLETQIAATAKMLAASEDVGRRAISVAHLGDNRAYMAMRLVMMNECSSSSMLSVTPMEGIDEENGDHDSGEVTDDSSSTEIMASVRQRRRSSSVTDKSMPDAKAAEDEMEEMPFAVHSESASPVVATGMPSRASLSFSKGTSITSARPPVKPTPALIRRHFSEALSCYVKALKMLKGAVGASQRVAKDAESLSSQRLSPDQSSHIQDMRKRQEVTANWLGGQFTGVLERAEAANIEISKIANAQTTTEQGETLPVARVEELIYNQALTWGREGAVKQLLGHYEPARFCFRSAGLLAETLLMETNIGKEDRKTLEEYVDGFAARITELDEVMLQQSQQSRLSSGSASSSRRAPAVVSLVGHPFSHLPSMNLGPAPTTGSYR